MTTYRRFTAKALRLAKEAEKFSHNFDRETVLEMADQALLHPSDAMMWDKDLYVTHTLAFHTPSWDLTDEYIMGEANYRAVLRDLSAEYPKDVSAATVGHWTYSSYSCIKVRVITDAGNITPAFVQMCIIAKGLEDYPLYDEDLWCELEMEVWASAIKQACDWEDSSRGSMNLPPLNQGARDRIEVYLSDHGLYEHEVGHIPDDLFKDAVEYAMDPDRWQPHQVGELPIDWAAAS